MLVLTRKVDEKIVISGNIVITVVGIRGDRVRIGIEAPPEVGIYRQELSPLSPENQLPKKKPPDIEDHPSQPASKAQAAGGSEFGRS